jgi:hypothetical protein
MTYHWSHTEQWGTQHAFKNQIPGLPSICGRGRFPQDATPPARKPEVCKMCTMVARPPEGAATGGAYAKGFQWAQGKMITDTHRNPRGYDE